MSRAYALAAAPPYSKLRGFRSRNIMTFDELIGFRVPIQCIDDHKEHIAPTSFILDAVRTSIVNWSDRSVRDFLRIVKTEMAARDL